MDLMEDESELDEEETDRYGELHDRWVKTTPEARQQLKDEGRLWRVSICGVIKGEYSCL